MQLLTYRNMPTLLEVVQTEVKKKVDEVGDGRPGEILKKLPKKKKLRGFIKFSCNSTTIHMIKLSLQVYFSWRITNIYNNLRLWD